MRHYTITIINKADNNVFHIFKCFAANDYQAASKAMDYMDGKDIEYTASIVETLNRNNDTYHETCRRLDCTFEDQSNNNPYPNISWLLGSDWACGSGVHVPSMSMDEYYQFAFDRAANQYE